MKTAPALVLLALALPACTRDDTVYPSLSPRAVEKLGFAEPEVAVVEAKPDPALDARIAQLGRSLDALAKGATTDAAKAEAAARRARGQAVGSDAWLEAQTALAQLDDWRAQTSSLLTDIDQIASDRAAALAPAYPGLATLRERASAENQRQSATIDRLQAALPAA
ncbi:hypothetical protein M9979_10690 [Sphingomonas sp. RP10(2022)]|uniref:Uncharacterized protein n=1 Tax=Sphingomonas liriopis TaxID=2949094 RepID=A0A9X2HWA7_9SPHN|nr:hypothetical protein [Sphingomonas liriopis]MCP3735336.1 hypothetical protein [Sphingomonas liriopis]